MPACQFDSIVKPCLVRPTLGLFNFLEDLPLFDLLFITDHGPDSEVNVNMKISI